MQELTKLPPSRTLKIGRCGGSGSIAALLREIIARFSERRGAGLLEVDARPALVIDWSQRRVSDRTFVPLRDGRGTGNDTVVRVEIGLGLNSVHPLSREHLVPHLC